MVDNRVKISSIIENQLPEFVIQEFPLAQEFLSTYYESLDSQGAPSDLIQNISEYIKIDNIFDTSESTILTSNVTFTDSTIFVESTYGFPNSYGLLQIDDEIITYTNKTENSFLGCIRGFSGVTSYKSSNKVDELVFSETNVDEHTSNTQVKNLSVLFFKEFLSKIKKQILPGFEDRELYEDLNERLFIKQSKDFYKSKGTDTSFKILFYALYGSPVQVVKPSEYLIQPSDSQYRISKNLVAEIVSGDPLRLVNCTLYQDADEYFPGARGTITDVQTIFRSNKYYYIISLDYDSNKSIDVQGSIKGSFKINPKTIITNNVSINSNYIDVDSTIGFPESGELVVSLDNGTELLVTYKSKTLNQFFDCSGITQEIPDKKEINLNKFVYGYPTRERDEIVKVRLTGVLSDLKVLDNPYLYNKNDTIQIKTLGDDRTDLKSNNWFFNVPSYFEVQSVNLLDSSDFTYKVNLFDDHSFVIGDKFTLTSSNGVVYNGNIIFVESKNVVVIRGQGKLEEDVTFTIKKNISKVDIVNYPELNFYSSNVQNVYSDLENSIYVTSPSLPTYLNQPIRIQDESITFYGTFDGYDLEFRNENGILITHSFYTGDIVVYKPSNSSTQITQSGVYYVKKVNKNTIRLSQSKENLFNLNENQFIKLSGISIGDRIELFDYNDRSLNFKRLKPQSLIRKLTDPINDGNDYETQPGPIGIFINGVELFNYKSKDLVFYGPIEQIIPTSRGNGYDVISPPSLNVIDSVGDGCVTHCSVDGSLQRIDILDPGFDYLEIPKVIINGGNGTGAKAKVNLISYDHVIKFDASSGVNLTNDSIGFSTYHKFRDFEEIIYDTNGNKGITGLSTNSTYYVAVQDEYTVKLHKSSSDALVGINTINLTGYGFGLHSLKSKIKKKKIGSIDVENSGYGYKNRKISVDPIGVNTSSSIITIKRHGYETGDVIQYNPSGTPIGGLSSSTSYYLTKIDDNNFRLSYIGNGLTGISSEKKDFYFQSKQYVNFTSIGSGRHYFNYEPITVNIVGKVGISSVANQIIQSEVVPIFRGEIYSTFIEEGGSNYGSEEIINYNRQPLITLDYGSGVQLKPIISNGKIIDVIIQSSGGNYTSPPDLIISGKGTGAILTPVLRDGILSEIKIIYPGIGYNQEDTFINVVNAGSGAKFEALIKSWRINLVERKIQSNKVTDDDGFIRPSLITDFGLQYAHLYTPRQLRASVLSTKFQDGESFFVKDLQLQNGKEDTIDAHSPIIGWSYDGNPIYGPYAYTSPSGGSVRSMKSSYSIKSLDKLITENRPSTSIYPTGFFIEDYEYTDDGDLDEFNGRFCITPEYPNGVYAYFSTINPNFVESEGSFKNYKKPIYPYIVGNKFKSRPIEFNFDPQSNQSSINLNKTNWLRNTTPYNLLNENSGYEYIFNPNKDQKQLTDIKNCFSGSVESINVVTSGKNYKVSENIIFDNSKSEGSGLKAEIESIKGKEVNRIYVDKIEIDDVELIPYNSFLGIKTDTDNLQNDDIVKVNTDFEFNKSVKIQLKPSVKFTLTVGIASTTTTGIITYFNVSGFPDDNVFENDLYKIGDEVVKILEIEKNNGRIKVQRNVNNIIGFTSYSSGTILVEKDKKIELNLGLTTSYNIKRNKEFYFESNRVVGLGTTFGVGITSTRFLDVENFRSKVNIGSGTTTVLYFESQKEKERYSLNNFVNIEDSTNSGFNTSKAQVVGVGETFIKINFDTSALSVGSGVTAYVNKWKIVRVPTRSISIPNHNLKPNDPIIYHPPVDGDPIKVIDPKYPNVEIDLPDNTILYPYPINENLIGISTNPITSDSPITTNDLLMFSDNGSNNLNVGQIHSFETVYPKSLVAKITKNLVTVETKDNHNLQLGDFVDVNCISGISTTLKVLYNDYNRRTIVGYFDFISSDVDIENNIIEIENHGFRTGEKVVHTSSTPCSGLENQKIYYVLVVDSNRIKLTRTYRESQNIDPNVVVITSQSFGRLGKINPYIKITKYSKLVFDLSDSSLSFSQNSSTYPAFEFSFYTDPNFKNKFISSKKDQFFEVKTFGEIGKEVDARVEISFNENVPTVLYYKLTPINIKNNVLTKNESIVDDEQLDHNKIDVVESLYSGHHKVVGVGSTYFNYTILDYPEISEYTNSNALIEYTTTSTNDFGPINSVKIVSTGSGYKSIPVIKGIETESGENATLNIVSTSIGRVNTFEIKDIGFNYPFDFTIRPKAKLPQIIKVNPVSIINDIRVVSIGKNYTTSPDLIMMDNATNQLISDIDLEVDLKQKIVKVIKNTEGINNVTPSIIPINNSNGLGISSISYDSVTKEVVLTLSAEFSAPEDFPFEVGDKVFIENVSVGSSGGRGYNSQDYNYDLFTLTYVDGQIGAGLATITYNMSQYLIGDENPGTYDSSVVRGSVVPEKHFPEFEITLRKRTFANQEEVFSNGIFGFVEKWDEENEILKVSSDKDFVVGKEITGQTSKTRAVINDVISFNGFYDIDASSVDRVGWRKETGFLNNEFQRLHDSDYYQYFSYALKSQISLDKWDDPVQVLNHTVGFKKFSDLIVESSPTVSGITTDQDFGDFSGVSDFYSEVDLNCVNDFDLVTENFIRFGTDLKSNEIYFENKSLQDYIESVGNRVLLIDDLSKQFNSNPRPTPFEIVDTFSVESFRYRKYFIHAADKRFSRESEFSIVSLLHDGAFGVANEYGKVYTVKSLGSFDFSIFGTDANLLFYPVKFELNNYDLSIFSFNINDIEIADGEIVVGGEKDLGNISKIKSFKKTLDENTTTPLQILDLPDSYRSLKVLVEISAVDGSYYEVDELNLIHNGSDVYMSEYGQLTTENVTSFSTPGIGTYNSYFIGSDLVVDVHPYVGYGVSFSVNSLVVALSSVNTTGDKVDISNSYIQSSYVSIPASGSPVANQIISFNKSKNNSSYFIISIEDLTDNKSQMSEFVVVNNQALNKTFYTEFGNVDTNGSLGILTSGISGNNVVVYFTPEANKNVEVRSFETVLSRPSPGGSFTPEAYSPADPTDPTNISLSSRYASYRGTKVDIKKSFELSYQDQPIFERMFDASNPDIVNIDENTIRIPQNFFVTGEEVTYYFDEEKGEAPIEIEETNIPGIGLTDKLPPTVYIIKVDEKDIQLAGSATDALSFIPNPLEISNVGIGSSHKFISKNQNSKILITIDNLVQSPVVGTYVTTGLIEELGVLDSELTVSGITSFFGGELLKIDDEIMRIASVGFGSTNTILVDREWLGTGIATHIAGSLVSKVEGNYNIIGNTIYFADAPWGKVPINNPSNRFDEIDYIGLDISSKSSGRVFLRSGVPDSGVEPYTTNYIFNSLSGEFNGITTTYTLKSNYVNVAGFSTGNPLVLINDIVQLPSRMGGDVEISGNYFIEENAGISSIVFRGNPATNNYDVNTSSIPRGGLIISVGSKSGFGYQPLVSAGATVIVSSAGTIQSLSIGNTGSGYRKSESYHIISELSDNVGIGSTELKILNVDSVLQKLVYSNNNRVSISSFFENVPIVGYTTNSIFIGIGSTIEVGVSSETSVVIDLNNPTTTLINIGISTQENPVHIGFTTSIGGYISTNVQITNPGTGYTNYSVTSSTNISTTVGIGSTVFYVNDTFNTTELNYVSVGTGITNVPIVSVSSTSFTIGSGSTSGQSFSIGTEVVFKKFSPPKVSFDSPLSYTNIPLIYSKSSRAGLGTGATVDIVVGQGSSVISFELRNTGFGYVKDDILTIPVGGATGIPTNTSPVNFGEFQITVDQTQSDRFTSWYVGDLLVLDPIEDLFNGVRKTFPLKLNGLPITIKSRVGSNIDVQSTLLIFINDVLQVPGESYIFKGGSIITFTEAPKGPIGEGDISTRDSSKIMVYLGTSGLDTVLVDVLETVKVGDELRIKSDDVLYDQSDRSVEEIKSINIVGTNLYSKDGISENELRIRPVNWCKQTEDKIINGEQIGKDRVLYEPLIYPSTNIIKNVGIDTTEIFVESVKTFFDNYDENNPSKNRIIIISQDSVVSASATVVVSSAGTINSIVIENGGVGYTTNPLVTIESPLGLPISSRATAESTISVGGTVSSISIVNPGIGYTFENPPLVLIESPLSTREVIDEVSYEGDFGIIAGVGTTSVSIASTGLVFDFYIPNSSFVKNLEINNVGMATTGVSGIKTDYYFTITNSNIGFGLTSLDKNRNIVGVGTSFIDGVYQAVAVSIGQTLAPGIGLTTVVKVTVSLDSYNGLTGLGFSEFYGNYSWGRMFDFKRLKPRSFESYNNGLIGVSTSPIVQRYNPLKYRGYKT